MISAIERAPYEYKKIFAEIEDTSGSNFNINLSPIKDADAVTPLNIAARLILIVIRQTIRQTTRAAVPNFVALMQGGTTSRFTGPEVFLSMAYLASRRNTFPDSVKKAIDSNTAWWFTGIGLANRGVVSGANSKSCTVSGQAHGAALELVGTAAYDALFNFGQEMGLQGLEKYEILAADPRKKDDKIDVAIMRPKNFLGIRSIVHAENSPHNRIPDLVLEGTGESERTWIEFKSYQFPDRVKVNGAGSLATLKGSNLSKWNGLTKTVKNLPSRTAQQYLNAHRQAVLDYVATKDSLLDEWWRTDDTNIESKPSETITWVQVWQQEQRSWRELKLQGRRYSLSRNRISPVTMPRPWIGRKIGNKFEGLSGGVVTSVTSEFQALQKLWGSIPTKFDTVGNRNNVLKNRRYFNTWETTTGIKPQDYSVEQIHIAQIPARFNNVKVRPFTLKNFFTLHAGNNAFSVFMDQLKQEFGDSPLITLYEDIENGTYDLEDLEELEETISREMLEIIGPFRYLLEVNRYNPFKYLEDRAADYVVGDNIKEVRDFVAKIKLPNLVFGDICEDYR